MMIQKQEHCEKGMIDRRTDIQTYRWMDWNVIRAAWLQLKNEETENSLKLHNMNVSVGLLWRGGPIFEGHLSNFKVKRDNKIADGFEMIHTHWCSVEGALLVCCQGNSIPNYLGHLHGCWWNWRCCWWNLHGCWWPGSLCCHVITSQDTEFAEEKTFFFNMKLFQPPLSSQYQAMPRNGCLSQMFISWKKKWNWNWHFQVFKVHAKNTHKLL